MEDKWVRYWGDQLFRGLLHISSKGYCHLDMKCDNVLIDKNLKVKISDFGLSRSKKDKISVVGGSHFYRAPEICSYQGPYDGEKADVFAFGIVLYAIKMKAFPVNNIDKVTDSELYKKIMEKDYSELWPAEKIVCDEFKDLI